MGDERDGRRDMEHEKGQQETRDGRQMTTMVTPRADHRFHPEPIAGKEPEKEKDEENVGLNTKVRARPRA